MKCLRCNRELKNHDLSGMGKVCRMKANKLSETVIKNKIRIEPLFIRQQPRRTYLVFTSPRARVTVSDRSDGRFADCQLCGDKGCDHITLIARIDKAKFPCNSVSPAAAF